MTLWHSTWCFAPFAMFSWSNKLLWSIFFIKWKGFCVLNKQEPKAMTKQWGPSHPQVGIPSYPSKPGGNLSGLLLLHFGCRQLVRQPRLLHQCSEVGFVSFVWLYLDLGFHGVLAESASGAFQKKQGPFMLKNKTLKWLCLCFQFFLWEERKWWMIFSYVLCTVRLDWWIFRSGRSRGWLAIYDSPSQLTIFKLSEKF